MAIRYCALCERDVEAKRKIGVGSLILVLVTGGFWYISAAFLPETVPNL